MVAQDGNGQVNHSPEPDFFLCIVIFDQVDAHNRAQNMGL